MANLAKHGIAFEEAKRLGVTRQSVIKVWIAERMEPGGRADAGAEAR